MIQDYIREVPDFPKPGILFRDISPILEDAGLFRLTIDWMMDKIVLENVDAFVGIESRGFILASAMAAICGLGFIPIRKAGKLPPPVVTQKYTLEYGAAEIEIALPAINTAPRVVVVDDVLATGGTMNAALHLCTQAGYVVQDAIALVHINKSMLSYPVKGVVYYE